MTTLIEGKKGTHHTDMIYTVETGGAGGQPKNYAQTQNIAKKQTQGIHVHVDNRRPLITQAYHC